MTEHQALVASTSRFASIDTGLYLSALVIEADLDFTGELTTNSAGVGVVEVLAP